MPLMGNDLARAVEWVTAAMTIAAMGYMAVAMLAAEVWRRSRRRPAATWFTPGVSVMKSLKGLDPELLDAFRSHCRQQYAGGFELLFGVSSLAEPAAAAVQELKREFPAVAIRLIECPERLGANGKISTLAQMTAHARYGYLLINDSDITVSPRYLERVMARFAPRAGTPVGMVTALYRGRAHGTLTRRGGLSARLEALGIATDFMPGVLVARLIERGLRFGLGSTLAVSRDALEKSGGLLPLVNRLADDYELGARIARAGYAVELCGEVVETAVPAYGWRGFFEHQLRWLRTVRMSRPGGYAGLVFTHAFAWALLNVLAGGASAISIWLLCMCFFLRLAQAMTVGAGVLADRQVIETLWLLPVRDLLAMALWVAGYAGNTIVWRGERFVLDRGQMKNPHVTPATANK
ncbi:MAG: bacteriohopanetetrol glucosamine biosynthesis glycosyltransferase HpnI [Terracidiphilus sp.]